VQWVDTKEALRAAKDELKASEIVGLDVETSLDFGTLCLLQIATKSKTFLIDPMAVGDLAPIVELLSGSVPLKVIHNARFERRVLAGVGIALDGVFDTLEASRSLRGADIPGGHSLATVCERELGLILDKAAQTSNWCQRPLAEDQLKYAALDAEVLLALHERFEQVGRGE
jgi:ribonuclease D